MADNETELDGQINIDASVKGTESIDKLSKSMSDVSAKTNEAGKALISVEGQIKELQKGIAGLATQVDRLGQSFTKNITSVEDMLNATETQKENLKEIIKSYAALERAKHVVQLKELNVKSQQAKAQSDVAMGPAEYQKQINKGLYHDVNLIKAETEARKPLELWLAKAKVLEAQAENYVKDLETQLKSIREKTKQIDTKYKGQLTVTQEKNKGTEWSRARAGQIRDPLWREAKLREMNADALNKESRARSRDYDLDYRKRHNPFAGHNIIGDTLIGTGRKINSRDSLFSQGVGGALAFGGALLKGGPAFALKEMFVQSTEALKNFSKEVIEATGRIQSLKVQMSVVYGNDTEANTAFNEIKDYAIRSPYGVEQTAEMAVLLKQSGVYASELMDTMKMIGDVSSGNNEKMKRIANNYAQIEAIGKATSLDMRQFAYAGLPIYKAVAEELKVSQSQLRQMIADGKVTNEVMEKVFKTMTSEGGMFYGAVDKGSQVISRRLQNLKDMKSLALAGIGETALNFGNHDGTGGLFSRFIGWEEGVAKALENWTTVKNIEKTVSQIEFNRSRVSELQTLLSFLQYNNSDKELQNVIKEEIKKLENAIPFSKQVVAQSQLYDRYQRDNSYYDKRKEIRNSLTEASKRKQQELQKGVNGIFNDRDYLYWELKEEQLVEEAKKIPNKRKAITNDMIFSSSYNNVYETNTLTKEFYDKILNNRNGLISMINKYNKMLEDSPEGKAAANEKEYQKYADLKSKTQNYASRYKDLTSDNPLIRDMNASAFVELSKLLGGNRIALNTQFENIFNPNTRVKTVDADQEWKDLGNSMEQIQAILQNENFLNGSFGSELKTRMSEIVGLTKSSIEDDDEGYQTAKNTYERLGRFIQIVENGMKNGTKEEKEQALLIYEAVKASLAKGGFDTSALNIDLSKLKNLLGDGTQIEPLWKRIIASATGISADKINNGGTAINDFRKLSNRQALSSSLEASLSSGATIASILQNLSLNGSAKLDIYDKNGKVTQKGGAVMQKQVDLEKLEKQYYEDAIAGKLNKEVVDALYSSKVSTLDVLNKLAAEGLTKGEDDQYSKDTMQRLISAFSGIKTDENGVISGIYNGQNIKIEQREDGEWYQLGTETKVALQDVEGAFEGMYSAIVKHTEELLKQTNALKSASNILEFNKSLSQPILQAISGFNYARVINFGKDGADLVNQFAGNTFSTTLENAGKKDLSARLSETDQKFGNFADKLENGTATFLNFINLVDYANSSLNEFVNLQKQTNQNKRNVDLRNGLAGAQSTNDIGNRLNTAYDSFNFQPVFSRSKKTQKQLLLNAGLDPDTADFKGSFARGAFASIIKDKNFNDARNFQDLSDTNKRLAITSGMFSEKDTNDESSFQSRKEELQKMLEFASYEDSLFFEDSNSQIEKMVTDMGNFTNLFEICANLSRELSSNVKDIGKNLASSSITTTFETMGENFVLGNDAMDGMENKMKELGKAALANLGSLFVQAGLSVIAQGGLAGLPIGLSLIAAGGMASFVSGMLGADESESNKAEAEKKKLESLKDQLADLLSQAREDAIYYENELRHRKALSSAENLSGRTTSVNDAIIAPNGNIVTTHPDDWLIATKTPHETLMGNRSTGDLVNNLSVKVINQSSGLVEAADIRQVETDDGMDLEIMIRNVTKEVISGPDGDDAFTARQARLTGRRVTA